MAGNKKHKGTKAGKSSAGFELEDRESGFTAEIKLKSLETQEEVENLKLKIEGIQKNSSGKALSEDQMEVVNRYIALKEGEVADLREQQKQYQAWVTKTAQKLEQFHRRNVELSDELEGARHSLKRSDALLNEEKKRMQAEHAREKADLEDKLRVAGATHSEVQELLRKKEEFKEKVREDLKRIKLKERELENKYELLRRDTSTLIESKDKHLLELKKKNDALDLELESLEERLRSSSSVLNQVSAKKRRLIETLRLAISLLEDIDKDANVDVPERKAG